MKQAKIAAGLAIDACGGAAKLSKKIGAGRTQVENWRKRGVSARWVLKVSKASGIAPEVLRPDIYAVSTAPKNRGLSSP